MSVRSAKEEARRAWGVPPTEELYLVGDGNVLVDDEATLAASLRPASRITVVRESIPEKKVNVALLHGIFGFDGRSPSDDQSNVSDYCRLWQDFSNAISDWAWQPKEKELSKIQSAAATLNTRGCVEWYLQYGCCVLVTDAPVDRRHLNLLCLDNWAFRDHSGANSWEYTSMPGSSEVLFLGTVDIDEYDEVKSRASASLARAQARTGDMRRAGVSDQGHQKTPAMIEAIFTDAIRNTTNTQPRGGFTDVGLHTGGRARHTAFFATAAVVEHHVTFFDLVFAQFLLWCTERARHADPDIVMRMLEVTALRAEPLADNDFPDMELFAARCCVVRHLVDTTTINASLALARSYQIPPLSLQTTTTTTTWRNPRLECPENAGEASTKVPTMAELRKEALKNLKPLPCLSDDERLSSVATWLGHRAFNELAHWKSQFAMATVENLMFERAKRLHGSYDDDDSAPGDIEAVVDRYRNIVAAFVRDASDKVGRMIVEIRSRELLVVWIAFCLVYDRVSSEPTRGHQTINDYRMALDFQDLRHLVLSDKRAVEAARSVARYIQAHHHRAPPVFSLRENDATLHFARSFARESETIMRVWSQEQADARARQEKHWSQVQKKKQDLQALDEELRRLEWDEHQARAELNRTTQYDWIGSRRYLTWEWVSAKKREIKVTEKPPSPVYQPLPEEGDAALEVLFFMFLPDELQALSRLSFVAQQMLLPQDNKKFTEDDISPVRGAISEEDPVGLWQCYYRSRSDRAAKVVTTKLRLAFSDKIPKADQISLPNVRNYHRKSDGVWHPNTIGRRVYWNGGDFPLDVRGYYFNPFAPVDFRATVQHLTEELPSEYATMQWMAAQYTVDEADPRRGNVPLAKLDSKPKNLSRDVFLALISFLHDKLLPLDNKVIGEIDVTQQNEATLKWKRDELYGAWPALHGVLDKLEQELSDKPRDHAVLGTVGEIADYASQYHIPTREIAGRLVASARRWAQDCDDRAKRCRFYTYGMLHTRLRPINDEDAAMLVELSLLACYTRLFDDNDDELLELSMISNYVMASRWVAGLQSAVDSNLLTNALGLIFTQQTQDENLAWKSVKDERNAPQAGCYEAISRDGRHLFSVNVLTGTALYDGLPPRQLPDSIRTHPLYRRTFGNRNFEVTKAASGWLETTSVARGAHYKFLALPNSDQLLVREIRDNITLELLESTVARDLPARLQEKHSHWLCRDRGVVLLRPKTYSDRATQFLFKKEHMSWFKVRYERDSTWFGYRVPRERQRSPSWVSLDLGSMDRLVLLPDDAAELAVLRKFEPNEELHVYLSAESGNLLLEMPRFGVSFEVDDDSKIHSKTYEGYFLSIDQQISCTMGTFTQYLVLEKSSSSSSSSFSELLLKVLVPCGEVVKTDSAVSIREDETCDDKRRYHAYDVHPRFKELQAPTVESRYQLAAIFAATATRVPEASSKLTGAEMAVQLARRSWLNRPLDNNEYKQLRSVASFSTRTPTLRLVCSDLLQASTDLHFLHPTAAEKRQPLDHKDALTAYETRKCAGELSPRMYLRPDEESSLMGGFEWCHDKRLRRQSSEGSIDDGNGGISAAADVQQDYVLALGRLRSIAECAKKVTPHNMAATVFPFDLNDEDSALANHMMTELRHSWELYQKSRPLEFENTSLDDLVALRIFVSKLRRRVESGLVAVLDSVPPSTRVLDIIHRRILTWLELCELEDTLERLASACASRDEAKLQHELREVLTERREWNPRTQPEWLVFEVEQRLRIRGIQVSVAMDLIANHGSVAQLNMGEGKTRVILPMLVLELSKMPHVLVRLHFLSQLIGEAFAYLHKTLTGGLLNVALALLPFHRDVKVTEKQARLMYHALERVRDRRGAVCVAPEHRLSLRLKWIELWHATDPPGEQREVLESLSRLEKDLEYFDILDESDEILSHKYHLVYAMKAQQRLPAGDARWTIVEELLMKVLLLAPEAEAMGIIAERIVSKHPGGFDQIRLLSDTGGGGGGGGGGGKKWLCDRLARDMFEPPLPYSIRNFEKVRHNDDDLDAIMSFVTDVENFDVAKLRTVTQNLSQQQFESLLDQLLTLRGMLAYGLLESSLVKRCRVDYGIDRRRRRVAVPFRACDTPSDRAEYAHPDVQICRTVLAYYATGLKPDDVKEAFRKLLTLAPTAQRDEYNKGWFKLSYVGMTQEESGKLDDVSKIDLDNASQFDVLVKIYRYNMRAINFWLNNCVFPVETKQFPYQIMANAWDLSDNPSNRVIGFSGTSDNKLLLPCHVKQGVPNVESLRATDGKMVSLIFHNDSLSTVGQPVAESVLEHAVAHQTVALIDAGALMAGFTNRQVALKILELLELQQNQVGSSSSSSSSSLEGVVFFEENSWLVRSGDREWPLATSPIPESRAFVYFDESRCRGADMKLAPDAVATLTVGPGMRKDKLMQAAGRMRQLDRGQSIRFVTTQEVAAKFTKIGGGGATARLLGWVMENTTESLKEGLLEWATQGSHFCCTQDHPNVRLLPDPHSLEELYPHAKHRTTMHAEMVRSQTRFRNLCPEPLSEKNELVMREIAECGERFGRDVETSSCNVGCDEECERELEIEREKEEEVERQLPSRIPTAEEHWEYELVLRAASPVDLPTTQRLDDAVRETLSVEISFPPDVFVTHNFMSTVQDHHCLDLYLRLVDVVLAFSSGELLLVSEREADKILELYHTSSLTGAPRFCNLPDLRSSNAVTMQLPPTTGPELPVKARTAVLLFSGDTMFDPKAESALQKLLLSFEAKRAAPDIAKNRDRAHLLPRSTLERVCEDF
ncbi:hypothetical protein CTAYLR_009177 [Chrysophaeum taylorii]|uniref:ubiquitinyl hydrolase 1 n=1 Tax=Chrysophaeum taylorii TaxID=2483200 RepID=A0AAD7XML4_9STRA|nr:hypothetical protein CTAYLR_009177 [Chrysophaeum taylorii]